MRRLLGAFGLLALLAVAVAADEDLTPDQVAAYVVLVRADQARDRADRAAALAGYQEALDKYGAIARRNGRWHPELVQYRIAYCTDEIERLRSQQASEPPAPPSDTSGMASPVPAPPEPPLADSPAVSPDGAERETTGAADPGAEAAWAQEKQQLEADLAEGRARILVLEANLQRAAAESAGRDDERRQWSGQATQCVAQVAVLTGRVAELTDQLDVRSNEVAAARTARDRSEAEAETLRRQLDEVSGRLAQLEAGLSACAAERDASAARLARAIEDAARAAAVEAPAPVPAEDWTARIGALSQELERTKAQLAESEREARELLKEVTFLKRRY